jgi:hypothetical protein
MGEPLPPQRVPLSARRTLAASPPVAAGLWAAHFDTRCDGLQVILGATLGITRPSAVTWLDSNLFTYALGFLMLSMGLTLTVDDFKKVPHRVLPLHPHAKLQ